MSKFRILVPYISDSNDPMFKKHGGYHTGLDIEATSVSSFAQGVVLRLDYEKGYYTISLQYDVNITLRYGNLTSCVPSLGDIVQKGDTIGQCKKFYHFEYLTPYPEQSRWPIRIGVITYFKHDPKPLLDGEIPLDSNDWGLIELPLEFESLTDANVPSTTIDHHNLDSIGEPRMGADMGL